jgi:transposase InsO family protein
VYGTSRLSPRTREFLVAQALRIGVSGAARQLGTSRRTVYRWRPRGQFGDRSSRPHRSPQRTLESTEAAVIGLRMETRWGPDLLGPYLGLPVSTTHRILRRHGAHRLAQLFPRERAVHPRFAVSSPGYIAIDAKSIGRLDRGGGREARRHEGHRHGKNLVGWRHLFVAIDLASRLVYAEMRPSLRTADAVVFLEHAVAFFDARGIRVRRVLTDNAFKRVFREACVARGARHTRTRPYHPWTNGRAEALINTIQRECLYARFFTSEEERRLALVLFVAYYNAERPHTALDGVSPERWLRARGVTGVLGDFS